jgi:adenosine deaminase
MQLSHDLLKRLPKTDLHCHYDGSLRLATVIELARRHGVKLFSYDHDALMAHMKYGQTHASLADYLYGFAPLVDVLQEKDDIERTFYEACADAAAENVWHLELRYCPLLLTKKGLRPDEVVAACARGAEKAEKEFNMSVRQILCGLKHLQQAEIIAELAASFVDRGVVGFDLAGPEIGYPIADHLAGIKIAKRHHLFITLHAGEATGPKTIAEALHDASAHRIGHGTSLINDEKILNYVIDHRIGIESCPLSNLHTGSVRSLKEHPLPEFLRRGVRVSINTDNRLVSATTITRELVTVVDTFNFGADEVHRLLQNGFKSAFLPHAQKGKLLRAFAEEWSTIMKNGRQKS